MLDPKDIFLPPDGTWRQSYTTRATVAVHTSFKSYCARLLTAFAASKRNIFLVGMEFALNQRLDDPDQKAANGDPAFDQTLLGTLQQAVNRGVKVRMLWSAGYQAESDRARQLGVDSRVDNQMRTRPFHQKAVYVTQDDEPGKPPILFVGGMDLSNGRNGWFDVQAEIGGAEGGLLGDLTLEERWTSVDRAKAMPAVTGVPASSPPTYTPGQTLIQFVRSYGLDPSANVGRAYPEDHGYLQLILRAIKSAKKFIYLEEQFFTTVPAVDQALADAVNSNADLVVVVIGARVNENEQYYREVGTLRGKTTAKNRFLFLKFKDQKRNPVLIHSKTWIIDDEFALIGSANYWMGSLAPPGVDIDSEFGVAIMAPVVSGLRLTLWNRLLASIPGAPTATIPDGGSFLDQLSILMDRSLKDLQTNSGPWVTSGPKSPFEVMPDVDDVRPTKKP
jgi:phosphatidylserine/phosphatidylglycerophosphate/cardiolipin synthase-like enzyme